MIHLRRVRAVNHAEVSGLDRRAGFSGTAAAAGAALIAGLLIVYIIYDELLSREQG
jgi:hypothetical protein